MFEIHEGAVVVDRFAVAGDWHGDTGWGMSMVRKAVKEGCRLILHAGDFGVWPGNSGRKFLYKLNRELTAQDACLAVTPGNHEDFDRIESLEVVDRGDGLGPLAWIAERIAIVPRGHRITLESTAGVRRTVVSLGGGPSLDFEHRVQGVDFWKQEAITLGDVYRTAEGGRADVMIAHEAPGQPYQVPAVEWITTHNEMGWSDKALAYSAEQQKLMTMAFEAVAPELFLHGHYHATGRKTVPVGDGECDVVCLPQQGHAGNTVAVDVDTLHLVGITNPPVF